MQPEWKRKLGDQVVRRPRLKELRPVIIPTGHLRHPSKYFSSPQMLVLTFAGFILAGGLILLLPISNVNNTSTPPINAFFTATSAVTVTGLTVVDTATYWSPFGQSVILVLIAAGGLGFMTLATFLLILIGQRITLNERLMMRESLGVNQLGGLIILVRNVILLALGIYVIGTLVLLYPLSREFSFPTAIWHAVFHSISGFNNAGFTIFPESQSLTLYKNNYWILGTISALIILGGISYTVLIDLFRQRRFTRLTLNTQLVLSASIFLWVFGAIVILVSEYGNSQTLGPLSPGAKVFTAFFHSISGRTAGFSSIDLSQSYDHTNLFIAGLMFIGGASGSLTGGIKINTFAVIIVAVLSTIRGRQQVEAFRREIPQNQVQRALTIGMISLALIFVVIIFLTLTEDLQFQDLLFETFSAYGTAGLSSGITAELSLQGKILLIVSMFIGKLGPLTLALTLIPNKERPIYRFAQERVKIG